MGKELHAGCFHPLLEGVVQGHEAASSVKSQSHEGARKDAFQGKDGSSKRRWQEEESLLSQLHCMTFTAFPPDFVNLVGGDSWGSPSQNSIQQHAFRFETLFPFPPAQSGLAKQL